VGEALTSERVEPFRGLIRIDVGKLV